MSEKDFEAFVEAMELWYEEEPTYFSPDGNVSESDIVVIDERCSDCGSIDGDCHHIS